MELSILPVAGLPEVTAGADLASLIWSALSAHAMSLAAGDVVVIAQKVVSKAEGRLVAIADLVPSSLAEGLAVRTGKPANKVEAILRESRRVVRAAPGVLITETRHGYVCANAGVDESNVPGAKLCLLPEDTDASARGIRARLRELAGVDLAVIVSDTFGRARRIGQTNVAIGVAGMSPWCDYRHRPDDFGVPLQVTQIAVADELAGAAELVMGKAERVPVAIVRGYQYEPREGAATDLVRPATEDLFR
ncbi:MAG: coenzyme F420-0:L-glutamate ligase [Burkholderiaceae bacterium]|nr:coenzyme F420-0:L-glutamate ligase [Burkholderiaceae bacterium]